MKSSRATILVISLVLLTTPRIGVTQTNVQLETDSHKLEKSMIEYITPKGIKAAPHFSPVVKINSQNTICVSGMTGQFNGETNELEEYKTQLQQAYDKITVALTAAGATRQDVVRQRF